MSKNFRFHDSASNAQGWSNSYDLDDNQIASIKDPDGANADREITSIPSPFARINLVQNAFKEVLKIGLEGKTIFHKMVSHALDIGEILFNYDKHKDDIEIISWSSSDLQEMLTSQDESHQLLGRTLNLFLIQDKESNNFEDMGALYLLNYKKGRNPLNIIGGTSPASLFFTSANNFNLNGFLSGNHQLLGEEFLGLHQRDEEFIKYMWSLKNSLPNFTRYFPDIDQYLLEVYKVLPQTLKQELSNQDGNYYNNLPILSIDGGNQTVQILGHNLKKSKGKYDVIKSQSGFRINPAKNVDSTMALPLVLPNDSITQNILYVTNSWDANNKAPYLNKDPLSERILPFDGTPYPYITISDFLEPVILRTPFQIDDSYFETFGYKGDKGYLLPIKPLFFDYFTTDFLTKTNINGQKNFEILPLANNNVKVVLRIPIQNNQIITFQRIYLNPISNAHLPQSDESQNQGAILEYNINLAITPFYKFPDSVTAEYNVGFYDADINPLFENVDYNLSFIKNDNKEVSNVLPVKRRHKAEEIADMTSYKVDSNFDYIRLENQFAKGVFVPKMDKKVGGGVNQFTFAIDFGTTNTHIEYKRGNNLPEPMQFLESEHFQVASLINPDDYDEVFLKYPTEDLLPKIIGPGEQYNFPQRTASAYHNKTNFNQPLFSMGNVAIPFSYEQQEFSLSTEVQTNLKWDQEQSSMILMSSFFEQIIKMIRNKVFLNNGDLDATQILWTYPASMTTFQLNRMENEWDNIIARYLGNKVKVASICESLAPFYYYKNLGGVTAANKPFVTIDIGGGTSDIAIFKKDDPILFTSYRFAGDAIFGDNYNRSILINGFVLKYFEKINHLLEQNNLQNLGHVLENIKSRNNNSNDVINALFSVEQNREVQDKQVNISFLSLLQNDEELKIIFLLFYVAQIYHLAKLIFKKRIEIPGLIVFSGTASKLLTIIDLNGKSLQRIAKLIFTRIFKPDEDVQIRIKLAENPKELTSKGGLFLMDKNIDLEEIRDVLITNENLASSTGNNNYNSQNIERFEDLTMKDFNDFMNLFFELNRKMSFTEHFGISNKIIASTKTFLEQKALDALKTGIEERLKTIASPDDEPIKEPFFFYPLVGSFGELAYNIHKQNSNDGND